MTFMPFSHYNPRELPTPRPEANEEHHPHEEGGQPELHIYGSDEDGWVVWLNTGIVDHDGLCIGTGETRDLAVAKAVAVAEWIERTLQRQPPPAFGSL